MTGFTRFYWSSVVLSGSRISIGVSICVMVRMTIWPSYLFVWNGPCSTWKYTNHQKQNIGSSNVYDGPLYDLQLPISSDLFNDFNKNDRFLEFQVSNLIHFKVLSNFQNVTKACYPCTISSTWRSHLHHFVKLRLSLLQSDNGTGVSYSFKCTTYDAERVDFVLVTFCLKTVYWSTTAHLRGTLA